MKFPFPSVVGLLLAFSLSSCNSVMGIPSRIIGTVLSTVHLADAKKKDALKNATAREPQAAVASAANTAAVGEVSYVDAESGFVLIRQWPAQHILASTPLLAKTTTGSITAKLLTSPANKGSFVAADIVSGAPERGNPVHLDAEAKAKGETKVLSTPTTSSKPADPVLPPMQDLRPPSGNLAAPELPTLPQ